VCFLQMIISGLFQVSNKEIYQLYREHYQIELHSINMVKSVERIMTIINELKMNLIVNDVGYLNATCEARKARLKEAMYSVQLKRDQFEHELLEILCHIKHSLNIHSKE
jgi:hypothetical protein